MTRPNPEHVHAHLASLENHWKGRVRAAHRSHGVTAVLILMIAIAVWLVGAIHWAYVLGGALVLVALNAIHLKLSLIEIYSRMSVAYQASELDHLLGDLPTSQTTAPPDIAGVAVR